MTIHVIKIEGSLNLSNGVPLRWQKPDGTAYVSIFVLDNNGPLPIARSDNINADSKLTLRSLTLVETNDPSEINLVRTGNDVPGDKDENAGIASGAVTGLIRWMGRLGPKAGYVKAAEMIGR